MLLRLYSKEALWKELIRRETFDEIGSIEATVIWSHVFSRSPELLGFLRKRELALLKGTALADKPQLFVLGQIAENRLWQRFDTGARDNVTPEVPKKLPKIKPMNDFLKGFKKKNDDKE